MESEPDLLRKLIITSNPDLRNRGLSTACQGLDAEALAHECSRLDAFWRTSENLYHRVRALLFLHALYRYELPARDAVRSVTPLPEAGVRHLWERRFEDAVDIFPPQAPDGT